MQSIEIMKLISLNTFFILTAFRLFADTYPKNFDIDIMHYRFELALSDDSDKIIGKATIQVLFKKEGINQLRLDLINKSEVLEGKGMSVNSISLDNRSLNFNHQDDVLWIDLPVSSTSGQIIEIEINYQGIPATGLIIGPNKHDDRTFFSDNWPNKARNWLPTVDHPYDKATAELIITAPLHYSVISNGLKMEESVLEGKLKRTHWKQSVPISTWLYALGVAEFAVQYVDTFDGKSIQTWVYKQDRDAGFYAFEVPTKQTLEFFTDYAGPFAYEKLANIQSNSVGGGMEAATAIFYGDKSVTNKRSTRWRNVIIHEVAHQWFGNAVTELDWDDVWLSEGFATYFTLLFREYAYGRDDFVTGLKEARKRVFDFYDNNKTYRIVHDNLSDMGKVTTGQTYQKGAWVLHMLRCQIGYDEFRNGIQSYYKEYLNGNATTFDFKRHMEMASGMQLDIFFNQWLYQGGNVVLEGDWKYDEKERNVNINLAQVQNDGFEFQFPVELGLYFGGQTEPIFTTVEMNKMKDNFKIKTDQKPVHIEIDPYTKLLAMWKIIEAK